MRTDETGPARDEHAASRLTLFHDGRPFDPSGTPQPGERFAVLNEQAGRARRLCREVRLVPRALLDEPDTSGRCYRRRMAIRGLIFDLDGLILDTEGPELASWQEEFARHGVELAFDAWRAGIGTVGTFDPYDHLESMVGSPVDREAVRARREARFRALMSSERVLPGVERLIAEARAAGLSLGLASSSTRAWVEGFLGDHGLEAAFHAIRAREDVAAAKPAPDLYLATLAALRLEPGEAIALEDSPNGIAAATAARIFCVAVPNPTTSRLGIDGADLVLDSLADVSLDDLIGAAGRR
jgi:HAD superfamily hydrolase (TIGR01509 family)